jgi:hypothetical protein
VRLLPGLNRLHGCFHGSLVFRNGHSLSHSDMMLSGLRSGSRSHGFRACHVLSATSTLNCCLRDGGCAARHCVEA